MAACLQPSPESRPTAAQVVDELERLSWSMDERNPSLIGADVDVEVAADVATDVGVASNDVAADPHDRRPSPAEPILIIEPAASIARAPSAGDPATDETVARPDRRPPPRPEPESAAPRRRWGLIGAVSVGVVQIGAGLVWRLQRDAGETDRPGVADELVVVARPTELVDVTEVEWPLGSVGECLVQSAARTVLVTVDCAEPHDLQRVGVGQLDIETFPPGVPFEAATVRSVVRSECDAAYEVFVGVSPAASEFDAPFSAPSADTWVDGDRRFQCLLGLPAQRLAGSAAATGR